ncbi:hypothetical protein ACROYT_G025785 [Oculina patagonica]
MYKRRIQSSIFAEICRSITTNKRGTMIATTLTSSETYTDTNEGIELMDPHATSETTSSLPGSIKNVGK